MVNPFVLWVYDVIPLMRCGGLFQLLKYFVFDIVMLTVDVTTGRATSCHFHERVVLKEGQLSYISGLGYDRNQNSTIAKRVRTRMRLGQDWDRSGSDGNSSSAMEINISVPNCNFLQ